MRLPSSYTSYMLGIDRALEATWLLIVVLVPLAALGRTYGEWSSVVGSFELPKIALLRSLVGLMAALSLAKWAIEANFTVGPPSVDSGSWLRPYLWPSLIYKWSRVEPFRWLFLAAGLFLVSVLLSTALSGALSTSLWGDIPGQDSYSAYTVVAYVALFGIIAVNLRTTSQVWRLLGAVVLVGTAVGGYSIFQNFGLDFLNLLEPAGGSRSSSTLGNSQFAAALLLMTIPVSLAVAALSLRSRWKSAEFWPQTAAWSVVLAIQLLGIVYTFSRGPWLGTLFALAVFLLLAAIFAGRQAAVRSVLVLVFASVLTAIVLWLPSELSLRQASGTFDPVAGTGTVRGTVDRAASAAGEVTGGSGAGGLASRARIWDGSLDLMVNRPWFGFDDDGAAPLRQLVGYGPELFRPTYLLISPPADSSALPNEVAQAHNYFIHQGVELGFLGFVTSISIFVTLFLVGGIGLYQRRREWSRLQTLLLVCILAAMAGRVLGQLVSVARVSDLMLEWVLLAIFAALPFIGGAAGPRRLYRVQAPVVGWSNGLLSALRWGYRPAVVLVIAGLLVALTLEKNVNYLRAAYQADKAALAFRDGREEEALSSLSTALSLAPDVSTYHLQLAAISPTLNEGNVDRRVRSEQALLRSQEWVGQRPYDLRARLALAEATFSFATATRDSGLLGRAVEMYRETAELVPNSYPLLNLSAQVSITADKPEMALEPLQRSLAITGQQNKRSVPALQLKGTAIHHLGRSDEALEVLDLAVELNPEFDLSYIHRGNVLADLSRLELAQADFGKAASLNPENADARYGLGTVEYRMELYETAIQTLTEAIALDPSRWDAFNNRGLAHARLGQLDQALDDFSASIALDPLFAPAHNNLGFTQRDLGRLEDALSSLDEAVRLDPDLSMAYYNRALTHSLLGQDSAAQADADRARELGVDVSGLVEVFRRARENP